MTSKLSLNNNKSFKYDLRRSFKTNFPVPVLAFAFVSLIFIFLNFSFDPHSLSNYFYDDYAAAAQSDFVTNCRKSFICLLAPTFAGSGNWIISIILTAIGALSAITAFSFVYKKKSVNVYYSLGITRGQMFFNRTFACLSMLTAAALIPLLIDLGINIYLFGFGSTLFSYWILLVLTVLTNLFIGFGFTAVALSICGTFFETAFTGALFIFTPTIILSSAQWILDCLLTGYSSVNNFSGFYEAIQLFCNQSLLIKFSFLNPILFETVNREIHEESNIFQQTFVRLALDTEQGKTLPSLEIKTVLIPAVWLIISIFAMILAKKLFDRKKTENAGMRGLNKFVNIYLPVMLAVEISCLIPLFVNSKAIAVIIMLLSFGIVSFGLIMILTKKIKGNKQIYKVTGIIFAVFSAAVLLTGFDAFGYSKYIPEKEEIEKAYITINFYDYVTQSVPTNPSVLFYNSFSNIGPFETDDDLSKFIEVNKKVIEGNNSKTKKYVLIKYVLKNGRTVTRFYQNVSAEAEFNVLSLKDSEYNDKLIDTVFGPQITKQYGELADESPEQAEYEQNLKVNTANVRILNPYTNETIYQWDKMDEQLKAALKNDLKKLSYKELYTPTAKLIGGFSFINMEFYESGNPVYDLIPVYENMTETVKYLKDAGIYEQLINSSGNKKIKTVEYKSYQDVLNDFCTWGNGYPLYSGSIFPYYIDYNTEYVYQPILFEKKLNNKDQMQAAFNAAQPCYFAEYDSEGCFIGVTFEDNSYILLYISENKVPDFMKNGS